MNKLLITYNTLYYNLNLYNKKSYWPTNSEPEVVLLDKNIAVGAGIKHIIGGLYQHITGYEYNS